MDSGVLIYHFDPNRNVTRVQPGDNNFMDKTAFTGSNIFAVRFAHAKNHFYIFPPFLRSVREENSVSIVFLKRICRPRLLVAAS